MKKFTAFTLSEVLITLGIIGIVAAMVIPVLSVNIQGKQTAVKLKATHSVLVRAMHMAEEEYGEIEAWGLDNWSEGSSEKIFNNIKPFIKILQDCQNRDTKSNCMGKSYKRLNGMFHANYGNLSVHPFVLLNGTSVFAHSRINEDKLEGAVVLFFIDTNGPKQPNMWGRDLFAYAYSNGSLLPYGSTKIYDWKNYCVNRRSTGYGCAYYVMQYEKMNYLNKI